MMAERAVTTGGLEGLPLLAATPAAWIDAVNSDLTAFLADHASCERKAAMAAMSFVGRYSEYPVLQARMIALAREELEHFEQVFHLLRARGATIGLDEHDPYVKGMLPRIRTGRREHLLDRLLMAALIEARSCERFRLAAAGLADPELRPVYAAFAAAEARHFPLFMSCAHELFPAAEVDARLQDLLPVEAQAMRAAPLRPAVH